MLKLIQEEVKQHLKTAESLYCKLVLLVGDNSSGKTTVLNSIASEFNVPVINVNLRLSEKLLDLTAKQRVTRLPILFNEIAQENNSVIVLDNLEILFEKELKQDPLKLLQGLSRNHYVVASWNGKPSGKKLSYASPDHPEYKKYEHVDALIVRMEDTEIED